MGLFSSIFGGSSASTSTTTQQTDQRQAGGDGSVFGGANSIINMTSNEAFALADRSYDSTDVALAGSFGLVEQVLASNTALAEKSTNTSLQAVSLADGITRSDASQNVSQFLKFAFPVGVLGYAAIKIWGK